MSDLTALLKKKAYEIKDEGNCTFLTVDHVYVALLYLVANRNNNTINPYGDTDEFKTLLEKFDKLPVQDDVSGMGKMINEKEYNEQDKATGLSFITYFSFTKSIGDICERLAKEDNILKYDKFLKKPEKVDTPPIFDKNFEETDKETKEAEEPVKEETKPDDLATIVENTAKIRAHLQKHVFGQDHVIKAFAEGYFQGEMTSGIDIKKKGPKAIFLFAGSPGTGKTYLSELVAEAIDLPYKRFDMSGYTDNYAVNDLCGYESNYKSAKEGALTGFVRKNPKCILLFDEIEKAHFSAINIFLQILDAGIAFDNKLEENVSFKDAIIIFTTNAGKQLYQGSKDNLSGVEKNVILDALSKDCDEMTGRPFFPPAIISRLATGNVVLYNHLPADIMIKIVGEELSKHEEATLKAYDLKSSGCDSVAATVLYSIGGKADGRTSTAKTRHFFTSEIFELLRLCPDISKIKNISWDVDLSEASDEIKRLFESLGDTDVLIFGDKKDIDKDYSSYTGGTVFTASTFAEAEQILGKNELSFVLLDFRSGGENAKNYLNWEDVDTVGRGVFSLLRNDYPDLPVYIIETEDKPYKEEEKISFCGRGVRKVVRVDFNNMQGITALLDDLCQVVCYEQGVLTLKLKHQVLSFETAQTVNENTGEAVIKLFDFRLTQAIDAEDKKKVLSADESPNVHWEDIIVSDDVEGELKYYIEYLKDPKGFVAKGTKAPRGILMYGPPGTGKTTLAKVMATESGVKFLSATADQFISHWAGDGPQAVHDIFATARKYAPAILFIDEIDAIGKRRREDGDDSSGIHEILNALLTEMDGFKKDVKKPVFVMAATNLGGNNGDTKGLDPALVRRFDRSVLIDLPDKKSRLRYLHMMKAKNSLIQISEDEMESIAIRSTGMSLALLESSMEMAIRNAIRSGGVVDDECFDEAFETFNNGEEKKWSDSELERTAWHEAGHAFICNYYGEKPSYLTIVARGNHGGYMLHGDNEQKGVYKKEELLNRICVSLAGRAAEIVKYGKEDGITTGPSSDLDNATRIATAMVCAYGMYEDLGLATFGSMSELNGEAQIMVRKAINDILSSQLEKAVSIISDNYDKMSNLVSALIDNSHLTEEQIQKAING